MKKFSKDRASATLVTGVLSMLFLCLCLGFTLDLVKNAYLKNAQNSHSQQATEVAVKSIDARGSLGEAAAQRMVNEYLRQSGSSNCFNTSVSGASHTDETAVYGGGACSTRNVTLNGGGTVQNAQMPYIVIKLDTARASGVSSSSTATFISAGGSAPVLSSGSINPNAVYRVISAEVYDSANNFILSIFNIPCQGLHSSVSAISFGSQEDLTE